MAGEARGGRAKGFVEQPHRPELGAVTEELNRRWYEANTGQVITDVRMGGIDLARLLGRRDGEPETNGGGAHLCATLCSFHPRGHREDDLDAPDLNAPEP